MHRHRWSLCLVLLVSAISAISPGWAATGKLLVLVQDVKDRPVRNVEIGIEGAGGSGLTGDDGKVLLPLTKDTNENEWVSLQVLHSPKGKDFVMVSPWDRRTLVPSFRDKAENFVRVVVVQHGDRSALESHSFLAALATKINKANTQQPANGEGALATMETKINNAGKQLPVESELESDLGRLLHQDSSCRTIGDPRVFAQ